MFEFDYDYDYPLYRPPSEAYSLILQVSIGCSHNACTFCTMYKSKKYRQKTWPEIEQLIKDAARQNPHTRRIFLADGNALALPTEILIQTLESLYLSFPVLERVSIYGGPNDALVKTDADLKALQTKGLNLVYLGVESGSDLILKEIKKGVCAEEMIRAGKKIKNSGLKLSTTLISGLGGKKHWKEHAIESAKVVSAMNPDYLGTLTLVLKEGAPMLKQIVKGEFQMLTPWEVLQETKLFVEHLDLSNCTYRSNHASNYVNLAGILNRDKNIILENIEQYLANPYIKSLSATNDRGL